MEENVKRLALSKRPKLTLFSRPVSQALKFALIDEKTFNGT